MEPTKQTLHSTQAEYVSKERMGRPERIQEEFSAETAAKKKEEGRAHDAWQTETYHIHRSYANFYLQTNAEWVGNFDMYTVVHMCID